MPFGENGFIAIRFEVAGQKAVEQRLATFGQRIESLAPAWEQVGEDLLEDFGRNFDIEGGLFGSGGWAQWPELAKSTVQDRIRRGYGGAHPILVRKGDLLDSVSRRGSPGNVFEVRENGLTIGTEWPIAHFHQTGTRKMPARRVVGLTWQRRQDIVERIGDYVRAQAQASGLELG